MRLVIASLLCAALLAPPAFAQNPSAPVDDPEATVLSDLVVVAPVEGPAWWRVSKGDAVVWIMALPAGPSPKGMAWDKMALERRLEDAKALLVPPGGSVSLGKGEKVPVLKFLPGIRWTNGNVEEAMPPALATRFASARTRLKKPASRYATPIPATAFFMLYGDYLKAAQLDWAGPMSAVTSVAKRQHVAVVHPPKISAGELTLAQIAPSQPAAAACFDALLDTTEVPVERYRTAAAGWARGDLKSAIQVPREPFSICENRLFNQGATRRAIDAQVAAVEAALAKPGKTVAVAHLRALLADDGILDRLAAKGYTIIYPTDVADAD